MLSAESLAIITRVITRSHNQDHYVVKSCQLTKWSFQKVDCSFVNSRVRSNENGTNERRREGNQENEGTIGSNPFLQQETTRRSLVTEPRIPTEDLFTAEPGFADHSAKDTALVWRALVAEEHGVGFDEPFGGVVEDANIRVVAGNQITLS